MRIAFALSVCHMPGLSLSWALTGQSLCMWTLFGMYYGK